MSGTPSSDAVAWGSLAHDSHRRDARLPTAGRPVLRKERLFFSPSRAQPNLVARLLPPSERTFARGGSARGQQ